jgi:hypothetical protein
VDNGIVLLSESSDWMDDLEVLASCMTGSVHGGGGGEGGLSQCLLQVLELCGRHEFVSRLVTLPIAVKGPLGISPDGDDTMRP